MKNFFQKLANIILILLITLLGLILLSGLVQRLNTRHPYTGLFGMGYAVVVSPSMVPVLNVDDLIVYRRQSATSYEVGDIIVYIRAEGKGEILVVHRIIEMSPSGVTTKGDANKDPDTAEVPYSAIVGKMIFRVAFLGALTSFFRSPLGIGLTVLLIGLVILLKQLTKRHKEEERRTFIQD